MITPPLVLNLLLILTTAWILGSLFSRFGLPIMLGELLAGIILGPLWLGLVTGSPVIDLLADLGIFFVMFHTGMELDPKELLEHLVPSLAVALGGFVLPFALGVFTARIFGATVYQSLFVGMGISVTAIAVQAVILQSLKINRTKVGHILIGAAIADDILALIALSTLLGLAKTGTVQLGALLLDLVKVVAFFGLTILAGRFVFPHITKRLVDQGGKGFTFALIVALLMGYLAEMAGLHLIIGAFLAGQFVREEIIDKRVYAAIHDRFFAISYGFLVPIFFASLSFHLHFPWNGAFWFFALILILAAVGGKVVGCGLGARIFRFNLWEALVIGTGMNSRGAVELVVVAVVSNLSEELMKTKVIHEPLLNPDQFSGLVLMAFVTTLMTPLLLKWLVQRACLPEEKADFCRLWAAKEPR